MPSLDDAECTTDGTGGLVVNKLNHNDPYDSLFDVGLNEEVQSTQDDKPMDLINGLGEDSTKGIGKNSNFLLFYLHFKYLKILMCFEKLDELLNASCQFMEKQPVINKMENLQIGQVTSTINYNAKHTQINKNKICIVNENGTNVNDKPRENGTNFIENIIKKSNEIAPKASEKPNGELLPFFLC